MSRILLVTFGTRGDILPFCVLGAALQQRGHSVRFVTISDYHGTVRRFGLDPVDTGAGFEETLSDPRYEALFQNYFSVGLSAIPRILALRRTLLGQLTDLLLLTRDEVSRCDLVVFNAFAYFAGEVALETGRPAIRVMCQPLLPSKKEPLSVFGGRPLGKTGNRLSYEAPRLLSPLLARAFAERRLRMAGGRRWRVFANPLTANLRRIHHLAAFSPTLSPDPGDWPVPVTATGPWTAAPRAVGGLQDYLEAFLARGPAPVYVGFGSMLWGGRRNTDIVLEALKIWGGRAIVNVGAGGLRLPDWSALPPNLQATTQADHALLFPRVRAVVHHGGAGTTAAVLRAGRPSVILPLLGDQLYWGRRVAALGAAEAPIQLNQITAEDLAGRIARACSNADMAAAAARLSAILAREPGVTAALDYVEAVLAA
ncbi:MULTISPECIES: glycosyltransferase [Methylobacterium]|uniref:glycosyltransferase n=1 Tax=Methylobacterium TaxID=407 RepID=UPI001EE0D46D|nr:MULTISPECIES: glycosyltransferase [Methylobacterium]